MLPRSFMVEIAQSKEFLNSSARIRAISIEKFGPSGKDYAAMLTPQMCCLIVF